MNLRTARKIAARSPATLRNHPLRPAQERAAAERLARYVLTRWRVLDSRPMITEAYAVLRLSSRAFRARRLLGRPRLERHWGSQWWGWTLLGVRGA